MIRVFLTLLLTMLLAAIIAGFWGWREYEKLWQTPLLDIGDEALVINIEAGTSFRGMVQQLDTLGLTANDWRWRLLGRLEQPIIKSGEYQLQAVLMVPDLLTQLSQHEVIQYPVTMIEGWTTAELLNYLDQHKLLTQTPEQPLEQLQPRSFLKANPIGQLALEAVAEHDLPIEYALEGLFLPETYYFQRGSQSIDLLKRAKQALLDLLDQQWAAYLEAYPDIQDRQLNNAYELLILASIIEKETGRDAERDKISGVFHRRLARGMLLQTDPTVIYGMGESYNGNIRRRDLQADTAYNTYTRAGLPPTPIALAGSAAIKAAAKPAAGDALFFVAKGDGSGGHVFSRTLNEHNRAVQQYLRTNRARLNSLKRATEALEDQ